MRPRHSWISVPRIFLPLILLSLGAAEAAEAQVDRLRRRAAQRVERKVEEAVDKAVDAALPDPSKAAAPTPESRMKPGEGAWANYDFVPGERVLFADDFAADQVGDFPRRLELLEGNAEIVEWNGARWLAVPSFLTFAIPLGETLPQRFTVEFDFYAGRSARSSYAPRVVFDPKDAPNNPQKTAVVFDGRRAGVTVGQRRMTTDLPQSVSERVYTVRVMADGSHLKAYIDEKRVSNAPNVEVVRADRLIIYVPGWQEEPSLIGNIRIGAGARELYQTLETAGRVTTQGILFDTGSDRLRPESTPTLEEIATMMQEHPELRLVIEGHTDNVGSAAFNQTLSGQRAAAVVGYLAGKGISSSRLDAKGFGPSRPVASNDTSEGRQQNRRVELVRQ